MTAKFHIYKGGDSQFYFRLNAGNGENILTSEGYISKSGCLSGIDSVRKNAPIDERYERKKSLNNKYYFNLKTDNGEIIGSSGVYESISGRDMCIESVKNNAHNALVEDSTV